MRKFFWYSLMEENTAQSNISPKPSPSPSNSTNWLAFALIIAFIMVSIAVLGFLFYQSNLNKEEVPEGSASDNLNVVLEAEVSVSKDGFVPSTIKVKKGTKLTWVNQDTNPHQIASDPYPDHSAYKELGNGKVIASGEKFTFTFDKVGTFNYHDHFNPETLKGTVIVE